MIIDQALAQRKLVLDILDASERQASILLIGKKRSGKTTVLKEVVSTLGKKGLFSRYLDLRKVHTPPELFSLHIAGLACSWSLSLNEGEYDAEFLKKHKNALAPAQKTLAETILFELEKIKPDQKLVLTSGLRMLEELGRSQRVIIAVDNVERLLDLDNFDAAGDIFSMLPRNITLILSSSALELQKRLHGFTTIMMQPFTKEEAEFLIAKLIGKQPQTLVDEIFSISRGEPYVIKIVCERLKTTKDVRSAFLAEMLSTEGRLHRLCSETLTDKMSRARGQALLHSILLLLAKSDLKLSELARKLYRSAPVTKSLLERLMQVGLVAKKEKTFSVADPLLKEWLSLRDNWSDDEPTDAVLKEVRP